MRWLDRYSIRSGGLVESMGKVEDLRFANIDTAPAGDAVGACDNRAGFCVAGIQCGCDHLGLGADSKTVTAVGARFPVSCTNSGQAEAVDESVESTHRTNMPAPAVLCHEKVEQKHG